MSYLLYTNCFLNSQICFLKKKKKNLRFKIGDMTVLMKSQHKC